jgi:hypothetical protein
MKRILLALFPLIALASCRQAAATGNEDFPSAAEFQAKTPSLPAAFLDTTRSQYAWVAQYNIVQSILNRIQAPEGFVRIPSSDGSFGQWLRRIPLLPGRPDVKLFNGSLKGNQDAHHAVINMDVGSKDLQQCADAVMRLRAEYLYAQGKDDLITFNFTSGHACPFSKWKQGLRPKINGNSVTWQGGGTTGRSYANFKSYLQMVFNYAGTASLAKELKKVEDPSKIEIGQVFIRGGFPGHAVIVMDVAEKAGTGERMFLLAQS